jgi:hypothetical protein
MTPNRGLDDDDLRKIVALAAQRYEDVGRAVRLAASRAGADLGQLRAEIDRGLRTRRFLTYRESNGWVIEAEPIVAEIRRAVETSPTNELVELIQRAIGHVVKVILHADDSDGAIGNVAHELLDLHASACEARVADPLKLAAWMIRFPSATRGRRSR